MHEMAAVNSCLGFVPTWRLQFKDVTLSDEERRNLNYENYEDALPAAN